jgi:hypothetical protein
MTKGKYGKIIFSETEIQFIKNNFQSMTNDAMAKALQCKKTIVRNKAYDLGLQRINLEHWTQEQTAYLKANYKLKGNRELVREFTAKWHKNKGWTTRQINKKIRQLGLFRNKQDLFNIIERNRQQGRFGTPNPKLKRKPMPKVYFMLDAKTRIEVKPGQEIATLKLKYQTRNEHLLKRQK